MTSNFEYCLEPGEKITGRTKLRDDSKNYDFDILSVSSSDLGDGSRVFLDINK